MAIIDKVEITISSGGQVLREYDVDPDHHPAPVNDEGTSARKLVKYIEATPGANFQINYSINEGQEANTAFYFGFKTWLDGQKMLSPLITMDQYNFFKKFSHTRSGSRTGNEASWKEEPYYWREILTVDEEPTDTLPEILVKYAGIGIIQVDFLRQGYPTTITQQWTANSVVGDAIPEKALKGQPIELGTGVQEAKPALSGTVWNGKSIDGGPYSTFMFLYRSKNALQILGVLPRTPAPEPLEDRDPETLTREELVELARRQQAQREVEKAKIKRETGKVNHPRPVIKRNAPFEDDEELSINSPPKKRSRKEVETIDLTE